MLHPFGDLAHRRAAYAKHLGEEILSQWKDIGMHSIMGHEKPFCTSLLNHVGRVTDGRLREHQRE